MEFWTTALFASPKVKADSFRNMCERMPENTVKSLAKNSAWPILLDKPPICGDSFADSLLARKKISYEYAVDATCSLNNEEDF